MRYGVVLLISLLTLAAACDDSSEPSPTGTSEPEAMATAEPPAGTLVYLRGSELWIASLDGESIPPRAITTGDFGAGYAGFVRRQDGGIDLYYMSQLTEATDNGSNRLIADHVLSRVPLEGGTSEELVRYSADSFFPPFPRYEASVSPDGEHAAYSGIDDVSLLDIASGESTLLLDTSACAVDEFVVEFCSYSSPLWAPSGDSVVVGQGLGEDVVSIVLNPFDSPIAATAAGFGFGRPDWSPDGERLCIWNSSGIQGPNLVVYDVAADVATDIRENLPTIPPEPSGDPDKPSEIPTNIYGCAWAGDGRLAAGFSQDVAEPRQIAVLGDDFTIVEQSDPIENLSAVVAWLPDGSGVIFNRRVELAEPPEGALPPGIFRLGAGVSDLPFEADTVLGIIP